MKGKCPAYKKNCRLCNKEGHFARVCQSSNKPVNVIENCSNEFDNEINFVIDEITQSQNMSETNEWLIKLQSNGTVVAYKLATGAEVNVLPFHIFNCLKERPSLQTSSTRLTAYNGSAIPVRGQCKLNVKHNKTVYDILFIVADTKSSAILGLKSCRDLNLITRVEELKEKSKAEKLFDEFKDCFGEIGTLQKTHHITLKDNAQPVIHSARRVPFALKDRLY